VAKVQPVETGIERWRRIAAIIGLVAGLWWVFFALASHGLSPDSLIEGGLVGGSILVATLIAWRWPFPGGILLVMEGGIALGVLLISLAKGTQLLPSVFLLFLVLPLPLLAAGILFLAAWGWAGRR
jgi:hypothetical protein